MSRVTLLATQGVQVRIDADFVDELKTARLWDGTPVPAGLQDRLTHDWIQLQYLESRLRELKSTRLVRQPDLAPPTARAITQLQQLRAIGPTGAWVLATGNLRVASDPKWSAIGRAGGVGARAL